MGEDRYFRWGYYFRNSTVISPAPSPLLWTYLVTFFFSIRLKDLQARDDAKYANEHAKNMLESHIFNMRDTLSSDEGQLLSTEEEREKIEQALSEAADWLDDEGWDSTADVS